MTGAGNEAVDAVFAAFGIDATYVPQSGDPLPIRVVSKQKDQSIAFDMARVSVSSRIFEVRIAEVAAPQDGDSLTVNGVTYLVQGEPQSLDIDRLIWTLDTRPA